MVDKTPTPAAPLTPEPPKCCPACGARQIPKSNDVDTWYACSQLYQLVDGIWKRNTEWDCREAFSAAIALRAERDDLQAMYQRAWTEIGELRARFEQSTKREAETHALFLQVHDDVEKAYTERDAALARAEKAEGERKDFLAERKRREELLHGMNKVGGQREAYWSMRVIELEHDLTDADADLTAARARQAELQAVRDAAREAQELLLSTDEVSIVEAVKASSRNVSALDMRWWGLALKCGEVLKHLNAALASGAESKVTK